MSRLITQTTHTAGPWQWTQFGGGGWKLMTPDRGRLVVMDCVRLGMQSAQPRFADRRDSMGGLMIPASELDVLDHPDALLISAAPEQHNALIGITAGLEMLREAIKQGRETGALSLVDSLQASADAAINKERRRDEQ